MKPSEKFVEKLVEAGPEAMAEFITGLVLGKFLYFPELFSIWAELTNWEKGDALYKLKPILEKLLDPQMEEFWRKARAK